MEIKRYRIGAPVIEPFVVGNIDRDDLRDWADEQIRIYLNEESVDVEEIEVGDGPASYDGALCRDRYGSIVDCVLTDTGTWKPQDDCEWNSDLKVWEYGYEDSDDEEEQE